MTFWTVHRHVREKKNWTVHANDNRSSFFVLWAPRPSLALGRRQRHCRDADDIGVRHFWAEYIDELGT